MQITRAMKETRLAELNDLLSRSEIVIFTNYQGLKAKEVDAVRSEIEPSDSKYLVTKNTLLQLAVKQAGLDIVNSIFDQPLACVFGFSDQVATAKALVKAIKTHEALEILGGVVDGAIVGESDIRALALLPGRDELLAKLVGSIASPLSGLVSVLSGNLRGLVSVLNQYQLSKN